ncbi:MAG: SPASM domain-containing protein [Bacteroidota bacterium]|nr:SPASM domain-containing protein [Bacteroidota bacterium]
MITKIDRKNKFVSKFDPQTGFYVRSGVIENGVDTGIDPFMSSFPELIDVGVMGHCVHGKTGLCIKSGVQCYQNGLNTHTPNMTLGNFKRIVDECKGKVYQLALGGRGDVDQHEDFEEILKYCRQNSIVPNFTTSGLGLDDRLVNICREYCGAVAVSWYRGDYTLRAINSLLKAGIKTNIHYVLGQNSINEAIARLVNNDFPKGINAVIFLLHKPVGLGKEDNMLSVDDPRIKTFFDVIDTHQFNFKIGFDSCTIPGLLNFTHNIEQDSFDTCEAARWSMYITADMKALPCSFDNQEQRWAFDISNNAIQEAWDSEQFEDFRNGFRNACPGCSKRNSCLGGCPIVNQIVLCNKEERTK